MISLALDENRRRMELYKQKLNDTQIAKIEGVHRRAIYAWRKTRNLQSNCPVNRNIQQVNLSPSPTLAYVLGVVYGDGTVGRYSQKRHWDKKQYWAHRITLKVKNKTFVEEFKRALEELNFKVHGPYKISDGTLMISALSTSFYDWFTSLDFKRLKKEYLQTNEMKNEFIRGFYESEGSATFSSRHKRVELVKCDKNLMEFINEILIALGYNFRWRVRRDVNSHNLTAYYLRTGVVNDVKRFFREVNPRIKNPLLSPNYAPPQALFGRRER